MARIFIIGAAAVLVLHSLIHLMGTAVYMQLTTLEGFSYKTPLLGGRWELGTSGTWGFGRLWLLAGAGTAVTAMGLMTEDAWVPPVLLAAAVLIKFLTLGSAVTAMVVGQLLAEVPLGIGDVVGFPTLTLIGIGMTVVLLRNVSDGALVQAAPSGGRSDQVTQALPAAGHAR